MAIYIEGSKKISGLYTNIDGQKKKILSAWVYKDGSPAKVFGKTGELPKIVTWAGGTDQEVSAMLNAHYNGDINIYDYWKVGDARTVNLSAMSSVVGETQPAQTVTMVLMNKGGKTLVNPINGHTECAFIVGQKNFLSAKGKMGTSNNNTGGWDVSLRRKWCNTVYKDSFPKDLQKIFKEYKNITGGGYGKGSTKVTSLDFFALPSIKEATGNIGYTDDTAENSNIQFEFYKNISNRKKSASWWTRSARGGLKSFYYAINTSGRYTSNQMIDSLGLMPFGVI